MSDPLAPNDFSSLRASNLNSLCSTQSLSPRRRLSPKCSCHGDPGRASKGGGPLAAEAAGPAGNQTLCPPWQGPSAPPRGDLHKPAGTQGRFLESIGLCPHPNDAKKGDSSPTWGKIYPTSLAGHSVPRHGAAEGICPESPRCRGLAAARPRQRAPCALVRSALPEPAPDAFTGYLRIARGGFPETNQEGRSQGTGSDAFDRRG